MTELLFEEESYRRRGAVFEVYREMGCGFLEAVYQEWLGKEFGKQKIPFVAQQELVLHYKGDRLERVKTHILSKVDWGVSVDVYPRQWQTEFVPAILPAILLSKFLDLRHALAARLA